MTVPVVAAETRIEPMTGAHAAAVLAIYRAGIEEGNATFETRAPGWAAFSAARLPAHRFVATKAGQVAGWVAASAVSGRCVYAGVVEHSVYVHLAARTQGTGRRLLDALITSTEGRDVVFIERRSPVVYPVPCRDRPHETHAECEPGRAGGYGRGYRPPGSWIGG